MTDVWLHSISFFTRQGYYLCDPQCTYESVEFHCFRIFTKITTNGFLLSFGRLKPLPSFLELLRDLFSTSSCNKLGQMLGLAHCLVSRLLVQPVCTAWSHHCQCVPIFRFQTNGKFIRFDNKNGILRYISAIFNSRIHSTFYFYFFLNCLLLFHLTVFSDLPYFPDMTLQ